MLAKVPVGGQAVKRSSGHLASAGPALAAVTASGTHHPSSVSARHTIHNSQFTYSRILTYTHVQFTSFTCSFSLTHLLTNLLTYITRTCRAATTLTNSFWLQSFDMSLHFLPSDLTSPSICFLPASRIPHPASRNPHPASRPLRFRTT